MALGTGLLPRTRARFQALPLRVRLVAVVVLLLAAALAASGLIVNVLLRNYLLARTDDELHTYAGIARQLDYPTDPTAVVQPVIQPNFTVQMSVLDGSAPLNLFAAVTEPTAQPSIPVLSSTDSRVARSTPFTVHSLTDDDIRWRVMAGVNDQGDGVYAVAVPLRTLEETLNRVIVDAALIGLGVLAASALIGWFAVRRAFRPLRRIEDTAAAIAAGDLTQRVPERSTSDEVASLSRSLNQMLTQIEQSFAVREASEERMRQFVADASHELRTPLATVRGYAELYRQGAVNKPEDVTGAFNRIESEAARMGSLVEDLLVLARLDGERPLAQEDVDLAVLAGDATQDARVLAPERRVRLVGLGGPLGPVHVIGDEPRLRQVMTNLVGNALNHTPAGSAVEVAVGHGPGGVALIEVRDHGLGIDPQRARRVFERFYRTDPSRSRARGSGGGSGLGLAIVAAIVNAHRGKVGVAQTPGGGATFVVELPQAVHSLSQADVDARSM